MKSESDTSSKIKWIQLNTFDGNLWEWIYGDTGFVIMQPLQVKDNTIIFAIYVIIYVSYFSKQNPQYFWM